MATSLERSQPHFNPENVAKIGRVFCEIIGLEHMEKPEAVSVHSTDNKRLPIRLSKQLNISCRFGDSE